MNTYIALLRAINLGSHNKVNMPQLRTLFEGLGYEDVETYLQSGNVVFRCAGTEANKLAGDIESRISDQFGLAVTVLVRSHEELRRTAAANPFVKKNAEPTVLHATFLRDLPDPGWPPATLGTRDQMNSTSPAVRSISFAPVGTAGPSSTTRFGSESSRPSPPPETGGRWARYWTWPAAEPSHRTGVVRRRRSSLLPSKYERHLPRTSPAKPPRRERSHARGPGADEGQPAADDCR